MGWFSSKSKEDNEKPVVTANLLWKNLSDTDQLDAILENRTGEKHVLFKHSTRCVVSAMAKRQLESEWPADKADIQVWYLDLLNHRDISNAIAEKTGIYHQSPQAIVLVNGEVKYQDSHSEISARRILKSLEK
jgi:bacillithiol system protein YtxJ